MKADPALASTPVVIVSSESSETRIAELMSSGASAYVKKPFRPEQLRAVVGQLTGQEKG